MGPGSSKGNLRSHALSLLTHTADLQISTYRIAAKATSDRDSISVASEPYLMYAGYLSLAFHWLKMEQAAAKKLEKDPSGPNADFYKSKIATSQFYFESVLPRVKALKPRMFTATKTLMELKPEQFAFNDA